jgi:hypothetical protein
MEVMDTTADYLADHLLAARAALARGDWRGGYAAFVRADGVGSMTVDDLDAYAGTAWRLGHGREAVRLAERVYRQLVRADPAAAAMKAVDLTVVWRTRGHRAVAADWADKAGRLLAGTAPGAAHGYLAYAETVAAIDRDDADALARARRTLADVGRSAQDPALSVLASVVEGVAAVLDGRDDEGLRVLETVLVPVLDPRVPIEWGGDAYRLALGVVERRGDADHARTFVDAMARWCEAVDAVAYRAICDVHRLRAEAASAARTRRATELQRTVADVDAAALAILEELLGGGAR